MSFSYERYDRRSGSNRRTTFGYWVPLILTATVATAGVAAWIWSAREESDSEDDADLSYGEGGDHHHVPPQPPPPGQQGPGGVDYQRDPNHPVEADGQQRQHGQGQQGEDTFMGRMSGAIRRTPSPSQMLDFAGKKMAAGVAAAGAVVGTALSSIREEERPGDYADHSRWSEEAGKTREGGFFSGAVVNKGPSRAGLKRRTVVIVMSAEQSLDSLRDEDHGSYHNEHPSLLSHLPRVNLDKTELLVLIYAPAKSRPTSTGAPPSLSSSYSAITMPGQQTPTGDDLTNVEPRPDGTPALSATALDTPIFRDMHSQALRLVENESCVLPFSTQTGCVAMLKHINPDVVYITEAMSGDGGATVKAIKNWVGQVVVIVGGDGGALGGLIDTDDEDSNKHKEGAPEQWWQRGDIVGLGKGVEVVDGSRVDEDFERRVGGRE